MCSCCLRFGLTSCTKWPIIKPFPINRACKTAFGQQAPSSGDCKPLGVLEFNGFVYKSTKPFCYRRDTKIFLIEKKCINENLSVNNFTTWFLSSHDPNERFSLALDDCWVSFLNPTYYSSLKKQLTTKKTILNKSEIMTILILELMYNVCYTLLIGGDLNA